MREEVNITAADLLNFDIQGGTITEEGVRTNLNVGVLYLESWLRGQGAVAIYNLMEDAATAEISRAQVWNWLNHPEGKLKDGRRLTPQLCRQMLAEELQNIEAMVGTAAFKHGVFKQATTLFEQLIFAPDFPEFLTIPAYGLLV